MTSMSLYRHHAGLLVVDDADPFFAAYRAYPWSVTSLTVGHCFFLASSDIIFQTVPLSAASIHRAIGVFAGPIRACWAMSPPLPPSLMPRMHVTPLSLHVGDWRGPDAEPQTARSVAEMARIFPG